MRTTASFNANLLLERVHSKACEESADWFIAKSDVAGASGSLDHMSEKVHNVSWVDCLLFQSRLTATVFENCQFERVVFDSCDLSAVTFIDCSFKECMILGGKSTAHLSFVASAMVGLTLEGVKASAVEIQNGRIYKLAIKKCDFERLTFAAIAKPKSRSTAEVAIVDTTLGGVGGITQMAENGVTINVDAQLWAMFGDLLLRQIGIGQIDALQ